MQNREVRNKCSSINSKSAGSFRKGNTSIKKQTHTWWFHFYFNW